MAERDRNWMLWVLPLAFLVHDGEELATIPGWMAANGARIPALVRDVAPAAGAGTASLLVAMAVLFAAFAAVSAFAFFGRGRAVLIAYATLLGAFFVHGFGHLGQAAWFGGYTPGVVTAALVVIPASLLIYRSLRRYGAGDRLLLAAGATGAALVVPAILLALSLGRALG
jgi:hypothetical protein